MAWAFDGGSTQDDLRLGDRCAQPTGGFRCVRTNPRRVDGTWTRRLRELARPAVATDPTSDPGASPLPRRPRVAQ
ncbi:MAG: hypothetical protein M3Q75_02650 [Gemmatimonadota bacterium]|nr:hypothetical protein [Gemmatimonadota bacterium]